MSAGDDAPADPPATADDAANPPAHPAAPVGAGAEEAIDAPAAALLRARAAAEARGERRVRSAAALHRSAARSAQTRTGIARRTGRDPLELGSVVDRMVKDRGWSTPVSVGSVIGRWAQIVGPDIAAHCHPDAFRETTLHVVCDSTAWATQVRLLVPTLLARFDAEIGPGILTAIKVSGPTAPSWRKGVRHVRGRGPRDTYG
ncbi:hypothetical protein GCM10011512_01970 [Tersicoccus solisilvae]|uniref:RNA-binding protein n=1 Tax=Tersicoccus solisilvae TaxID=1882339 RepID=A0ABQ1NMM9_9MICC|nr:DciA family protein [Tersicoccus solisilvae]GGC78944.1 hypothetical protein GCM10011512_01970 [Tersicoccus solisilvae]